MTPRISGHFSIFGLVFFVLNSLLGIAKQWSREKFAILALNPRSHVRILMYRTWAIQVSLTYTVGQSIHGFNEIHGKLYIPYFIDAACTPHVTNRLVTLGLSNTPTNLCLALYCIVFTLL